MKIDSIRFHLKPYSIYGKRKTTINHAFASAIASNAVYDRETLSEAVRILGQDAESDLSCVYCGQEAETWDHVVGLVKDNEFSGFGHVIGNLVPCCRGCNQKKGNKNWRDYFATPAMAALPDRARREKALEGYVAKYARTLRQDVKFTCPQEIKELNAIKVRVLKLLKSADAVVKKIRRKIAQ